MLGDLHLRGVGEKTGGKGTKEEERGGRGISTASVKT